MMATVCVSLTDDLPVASEVPIEIDSCNLLESASNCGGPSFDESYGVSSSPAVPPDYCKSLSTPPTWETHTISRDSDILDEVHNNTHNGHISEKFTLLILY